MRQWINIITEASRPKPTRQDLLKHRAEQILRMNGGDVVAETPAGSWYFIPPEILEKGVVEHYRDGELERFTTSSNPQGIYHLPDKLVATKYGTNLELWTYSHGEWLRFIPLEMETILPTLLNPLVLQIGADKIMHRPELIKDQNGTFNYFLPLLAREGTLTRIPNGDAYEVTVDFVERAQSALEWRGAKSFFIRQKPDKYYIIKVPDSPNILLAAIKNGKQIGASSRLTKDKQAQLLRELGEATGIEALSAKIKPNSMFHDMLEFFEMSPGNGRSGWKVYVGKGTELGASFENELDGLAARMKLITVRDPGRKDSTYQFRLTPLGKEVLDKLNSGETISISDYI